MFGAYELRFPSFATDCFLDEVRWAFSDFLVFECLPRSVELLDEFEFDSSSSDSRRISLSIGLMPLGNFKSLFWFGSWDSIKACVCFWYWSICFEIV